MWTRRVLIYHKENEWTQTIIQSQYLAALEMLKQVIVKCPAALWNAPGDKDKFWSKAYHTLFYAHLYLQETEKDFVLGKAP